MKTLNKKLTYLAETKAAIKTAIVEKGQTVEDTDTFRSYADKIRAIEAGGGGGSVEGTATVTFCNYDGTELFSRLVFVGDNCPDPIAQGKINEPTRESSAQYTYAYNGWSLTAGGTASASALNVVTGDRTVYAAYTQNVRYYTARFYDGTTLMKEMQVAYGSVATEPSTGKDGYDFIGWTPSDLTIYADTDFYGTWKESTYASLMPAPDVAPTSTVYASAFFDNDNKLAVAYSGNPLVYDISGDIPTKIYTGSSYNGGIEDVAAHPDGTMFVVAEHVIKNAVSYGKFAYYVTSSGSITYNNSSYFGSKLPSDFYNLRTARFNRDGSRLIICADVATYIYDSSTKPFTLLKTISGTAYGYSTWGADNDTLYYIRKEHGSAGALAKYTISTETSEDVTSVLGIRNATRPALNHNYTRIAEAFSKSNDVSWGNTVTILNAQTGEQVATITLESDVYLSGESRWGCYSTISYSPDGKTLAVACKNNVYFYDATDDKYTLINSTHTGYNANYTYNVAYNSDGTMVAVSDSTAPYIHLYKIEA
jgi:hypothetical protein